MGEVGQQLDLDEHLFKPSMVVTHGNSLAGVVAKLDTVELMADEQNNTLATPAKLALLDKEIAKVIRTEGVPPDASALLHGRCTRHELCAIFGIGLHVGDPVNQTFYRARGRAIVAVSMVIVLIALGFNVVACLQQAEVVWAYEVGIVMVVARGHVKRAIAGRYRVEGLVAGRTLSDSSDFQSSGRPIADDQGIVVTPVNWTEAWLARLLIGDRQ